MIAKCNYCFANFEAKRKTARFCSDLHRTLFGNLSDEEKAIRLKKISYEQPLIESIENKSPSWTKAIEDYCSSIGKLPEYLIEFHKEFSGQVKRKKGKKETVLTPDDIESLKEVAVHSKVAQKSHEVKELEPGTNAYFLRHGCWE